MGNHVHISALNAVIVSLYVIVILGTLHLLAIKYKDTSPFWASWANLFGVQ
jgi:hypothetical protein